MPDKPRTTEEVLPNLDEIRAEVKKRQGWSLADQNRDSFLFLRLIDQLAQHVQRLSERKHNPADPYGCLCHECVYDFVVRMGEKRGGE